MVKSILHFVNWSGAILRGDGEGVSRADGIAAVGACKLSTRSDATVGGTLLPRSNREIHLRGRYCIAYRRGSVSNRIVSNLLAAGAYVHARNRRGQEPLHAAALGARFADVNPSAQAATIIRLIEAGPTQMRLIKVGCHRFINPSGRVVPKPYGLSSIAALIPRFQIERFHANAARDTEYGTGRTGRKMRNRNSERYCGCWKSLYRSSEVARERAFPLMRKGRA